MSLVAHWRFEGDTTDSIGENNGSGTPTYVDGKIGQGIDGDNSHIDVPFSEDIESAFSGNQMSISLWWKQGSGSHDWKDIINIGSTRLERGNADVSSESDYWCNLGSGDGNQIADGSIGVPEGEWFHIVIRRKGSDYEAWINGDLNESRTTNSDITVNDSLTFAPQESGSIFDDVRLYDHAISEKNIKQLSQAKTVHYKFDSEDYSNPVADCSGQGYNGTVIRSPSSTTDSAIGENAVNFKSGDNAVVIDSPNPPDFSKPNKLTVSCWAKSNQSTWQKTGTLVSRRGGDQFVFHPGGGSTGVNLYVHTSQSGWESIRADPNDIETWNHYAVTFDNGLFTAYLNGEPQNTISIGSDLGSSSGPVTIGRDDDGDTSYGNEKIDDVRLYAEALSDSEIKSLYKQRASIDAGGNLHGHDFSEIVDTGLELEAYSRGNNS